jgi:hypothetical protein
MEGGYDPLAELDRGPYGAIGIRRNPKTKKDHLVADAEC